MAKMTEFELGMKELAKIAAEKEQLLKLPLQNQ